MHRDKKVGLALGVLLIGIVGAFFFRNEKDPTADAPQLEDEQAIDNQIAEKPFGPYLEGIETDETSSSTEQSRNTTADTEDAPLWEMPDFLKHDEDQSVDNLARSAGPPDPIHTETSARAAIPAPEHNNAWDIVENDRNEPAASLPTTPAEPLRFHRVRRGETLSGLAARYLGSGERFREIFAANRDVLKNPNDLSVGMTIRIPLTTEPQKRAPVPSTANATAGAAVKTRNVSSHNRENEHSQQLRSKAKQTPRSQSPKKAIRRFAPVRRSPLRPGARTSPLDDAPKPKQKLSQLPPYDLPDLDGQEDLEIAIEAENTIASHAKRTPSSPNQKHRRYTVLRGDSLEKIALRLYGKRSAARKIFDANRASLKHPDSLREGMTIILP